MTWHNHICGLYRFHDIVPGRSAQQREYLPQISLRAHTKIVSSASRTTLTQTFVNPKQESIPELRYTFPLYDGVSVVGFVCTINDDRVIRGVVQERAEARETYKKAVEQGETAGLLEQLPDASDVFTTTVGNVPANAKLKVDITYLGELKHDAEFDGVRFTIPTHIAPRYGSYPGRLLESETTSNRNGGISIVVDVEMPKGSNVKSVQSPSHPIQVTLGNTSTGVASGADMSLNKASANLALWTTELGDDFVLQVVATNTGNPVALLETHPTLPNHRALMASLVPKFSLPPSRPEIVFLCDRSGSMDSHNKIPNLKRALHLFLKSLPVGVKFNICSFGSRHDFLFSNGSRTYDASALDEATRYVDTFAANFGGTDIYRPMEAVIKKRYSDMDLEVFLLTDGEIWDQASLFNLLNKEIAESKGKVRVFSLGIGQDVSHALIEGVARAGNGFAQTVGDNENMNKKIVRMLKAALMPHITDYSLEVKYSKEATADAQTDDEFELVEKVVDCLAIDVQEPQEKETAPKKPISLFDESAELDDEMPDASASAGGRYSHVPPVSEPKLLQTPFLIPGLSPFSRTSVYLLLGPDTVQQQAKSVVLRGTSPVGPVELEIPVTVLPEKDETIHQLAARSAVKELEEGRGWIYHAKDAKDPDSPLLKDKFPGRFKDMVEREAVRLGVTYQVGGKWCSFVAVQSNQEDAASGDTEGGEPYLPASNPLLYCPATEPGSNRMQAAAYWKNRDRHPGDVDAADPNNALNNITPHWQLQEAQYARAAYAQAAQQFQAAPCSLGSQVPQLQQQAMMSIPKGAPQGQGEYRRARAPAAVHSNVFIDFGLDTPAATTQQQQASARSLHGRKRQPPRGNIGKEPRRQLASKAARRSAPVSSSVAVPSSLDDLELELDMDMGFVEAAGGETGTRRVAKVDPADLPPAEKLAALVALQTFAGAWRWEEEVLRLLGLAEAQKTETAAAQLGGTSDRAATALVLAFLEVRLGDREEEWEMLADKAREWLQSELKSGSGGLTVEGYCEEAKKLLVG